MERDKCETLRVAKSIGLPNSNQCVYSQSCNGEWCPKFGLTQDLIQDPNAMNKFPPVSTGSERFYSKIIKTAAILGIETDQRI